MPQHIIIICTEAREWVVHRKCNEAAFFKHYIAIRLNYASKQKLPKKMAAMYDNKRLSKPINGFESLGGVSKALNNHLKQ